MPLDLHAITARFSSRLYGLYGEATQRLDNLGIAPPRWLRSYLVFCALESCRDLLGQDIDAVYCRFSLRKRGPHSQQQLDQAISNLRIYNPHVPGHPDQLVEHLVDFSISTGSLRHGRGEDPLPDGVKYRSLLAAESELSYSVPDILEDCLKLVDVSAGLRILLFRSNARAGAIAVRKQKIEALFNANQSSTLHTDAQWLFLAIPLFEDWKRENGHVASLHHQVYTLRRIAENGPEERYSLHAEEEWWSDVPAPLN